MLTTRRGLLMGGVATLAVAAVGGGAFASSSMVVAPTPIRIRTPVERVWIGYGIEAWRDVMTGEKSVESIVQIKLDSNEYGKAVAGLLELDSAEYERQMSLNRRLVELGAVEILPKPWTGMVRYPEGWFHRDNPQPLVADVARFRYLHEARGEL